MSTHIGISVLGNTDVYQFVFGRVLLGFGFGFGFGLGWLRIRTELCGLVGVGVGG